MEAQARWLYRSALSGMRLSILISVGLLTVGCQTVGHTTESPLHEMIRAAAISHDVNPQIALGLIDVESTFKPTAQKDGNYGLMQIRMATAKAMGFKGNLNDLLIPENNLEYGMRYLHYCYEKHGEDRLALGCYNGSTSTKNRYPRRVLRASEKY
jgi:soluble lytic murein transglycosylase-like protein